MKFKNQGISLTQKEMKETKGGAAPPPKTLWRCLIEPGYYDYVCFFNEPHIHCGYSEPCTNVGLCSDNELCIY